MVKEDTEQIKPEVVEENGGAALVPIPHEIQALPREKLSVDDVMEQLNAVQELMKRAMTKDEDYGVIPGTRNKPTLLKPGSEKLCVLFRLAPRFAETIVEFEKGHREYRMVCDLYHINSGKWVGQGVGSCSTLEVKYRYRRGGHACPECGAAAIIKGKEEYGGGWLCWKKSKPIAGCGSKFPEDQFSVEADRMENPDIAEVYNTVRKMCKKRSLVDAVLTATAASFLFTQDVEDMPKEEESKQAESKQGTDPDGSGAPESQTTKATTKPPKTTKPPANKKLTKKQVGDIVEGFGKFEVTLAELEANLEITCDKWTAQHREKLVEMYQALESGEAKEHVVGSATEESGEVFGAVLGA